MRYSRSIPAGEVKFIHIAASEFRREAENHSEGTWATDQGGHYYRVINSFDQLLGFFHELSHRQGLLLDGMDFHTHGVADNEGNRIGISFDSFIRTDTLNYDNAYRFSGLVRNIFKPGANITFYGCAVAGHFTGEYFLSMIGVHCLKEGGTVRGYSTLGYVNGMRALWEERPSNISGYPFHRRDSSSLLVAVVNENGDIARIRNASYLTPRISREIVQRIVADARSVLNNMVLPRNQQRQTELSGVISQARNHILVLSGHPSYTTMYNIWRWLEQMIPMFRYQHYFPGQRVSQGGRALNTDIVHLD